MLWLDHKIFGNGHGMKSPYWDNRFYWLSGKLYTWIGGFGAQLESRQWRHPKPGEQRILGDRIFRPFNSHRQFLWLFRDSLFPIPTPICRVSVSWATNLPADLDERNFCLSEFQCRLGD
ncbi:hypothetical protein [Bradyrhizobium sp. SZCCHNR3118]|uniref:hypothetical protein n=1 Tax=Bradyrhizobium sp. SZCCHNR3118 TaxID=3057468 RepID=UPI002915C5BA|nr:hypothetical protein [Bradyrhizobium sp. SZCCHNR3118]